MLKIQEDATKRTWQWGLLDESSQSFFITDSKNCTVICSQDASLFLLTANTFDALSQFLALF